MKGYDDLILRVDFGSDGPDPIWRAGRRRLTPAADSAVARGEKLAGAGGSSATGVDSSGKEGQGIYAARVVHLGQDLGTSGSVAARAVTAVALGGDARRRTRAGQHWG